jgi:ssDNA-binding replication factor A large subunit
MDGNMLKLYEQIKDHVDETTFESELEKRVQFYEGLLSAEAIAYILMDEWGADIAERAQISDLRHGESANLSVQVEDIGQIREFKKRNGTRGRVLNITISDESGRCRLTLWDEEVEYVTGGQIEPGLKLRIINGYVKITDFGMEVNLGRWGSFSVI